MRTIPVILLALCSLGCDIEDISANTREQEDFHYTYPLKAGGRLNIDNYNGSVELTGWDKNEVEINGTKYASTKSLLAEVKIEIAAAADNVTIRTVRPLERNSNSGAKFIIHVPRRILLDRIVSTNGSVRLSELEGPGHIRTSNGSVRADRFKGDLDVETSNGAIETRETTGALVARTSNGRIQADGIRGYFEARTTNGPIRVQLADMTSDRPLRLATSNGSIEVAVPGALKTALHATTSNGSITLKLPQSLNARVNASTSNSRVDSEFAVSGGTVSRKHIEGQIGSGGPLLDLTTSNGAIRLSKSM